MESTGLVALVANKDLADLGEAIYKAGKENNALFMIDVSVAKNEKSPVSLVVIRSCGLNEVWQRLIEPEIRRILEEYTDKAIFNMGGNSLVKAFQD